MDMVVPILYDIQLGTIFYECNSEILWHKDVLRTIFLGNSRDKAKIISQGRWLHSLQAPWNFDAWVGDIVLSAPFTDRNWRNFLHVFIRANKHQIIGTSVAWEELGLKSQIHSTFRILGPFICLIIQGGETYHYSQLALEVKSIAMSRRSSTIQDRVSTLDVLEQKVWQLQIDYHSLSTRVNQILDILIQQREAMHQ
jgi:hypothetical protein